MTSTINFNSLVQQIEYTDRALQTNARLVINRHVTAKAWLTGYYIVEYEQNGEDRAKYGEKLLQNLSKKLGKKYIFLQLPQILNVKHLSNLLNRLFGRQD